MRIRPSLSLSIASIAACALALSASAEDASSSSAASSTASAASSSATSISLPSLPASCVSNPNKDLCIPDALRNLERAKSDYVNMVARKRQKWIDEHASMGRTTEYLNLLQAFANQLKEEGEAFMAKIAEQTKIITAGRTNRRGRGASSASSSTSSNALKTKVEQQDIDRCASITDERKRRLCVRTLANEAKARPRLGKTYR